MAKGEVTKKGHRIHFYVTKEQYESIEECVNLNDMTCTAFCREAVEYYLESKRREAIHKQLAETCLILKESNTQNLKQWTTLVKEIGQT